MSAEITIRRLDRLEEQHISALALVLQDCVEGGASVGFMQPFTMEKAIAFWRRIAQGVAAGVRVLLVAESAGEIIGTVQLVMDMPENQPHRGDISKMLVHRKARNKGAGAALMAGIEAEAKRHGRSLLVLDTASDAAYRLYTRMGWSFVGEVPNFARWPQGGFCPTWFFYKLTETI